ncbi:nuclear transport factor 2 family protein [Streptomyces dangxiongensis]|uniref:Nuclear transport factor 2 family protein n=1 Tax=Streptomyces dangxiongensis TaxID=1442032 RepID=A0A3G2J8J1_9ACTN|nr:nuclear transport factor 2 family protein [Streptomyces dangxiongensis]
MPHRPADSFTGRERVLMNWSLVFTRVPDLQARVLRTAVSGSEVWSEWEQIDAVFGGGGEVRTQMAAVFRRSGSACHRRSSAGL